jgi:hypothetical protein
MGCCGDSSDGPAGHRYKAYCSSASPNLGGLLTCNDGAGAASHGQHCYFHRK